MNWYTRTRDWVVEKLNPAQSEISTSEGTDIGTTASYNYLTAFKNLEVVNRGVSMIVSACASLDYDMSNQLKEKVIDLKAVIINLFLFCSKWKTKKLV